MDLVVNSIINFGGGAIASLAFKHNVNPGTHREVASLPTANLVGESIIDKYILFCEMENGGVLADELLIDLKL